MKKGVCKFCGFDPAGEYAKRPALHYAQCDEHHVQVCPNCWVCPTVRKTPKVIALARKRASYKTWEKR